MPTSSSNLINSDRTWPSVAIVILTWNQKDLTLECLESLQPLDYPADCLQVIVVDNGSSDDTAQAVRARYPQVALFENAANVGFAAGNNVGIAYALKGDAEYIMLLNNDTAVAPDMLKQLMPVIEADPHIGIVTPKIYYYAEPTRIWCAGAAIDWRNGTTRRLRADEFDDGTLEAPHEVDFASGCALCVRRELIDRAGLLDPRFFIYYEETEWCMRLMRSGARCVYVPQSKVWHKVSSAMKEGSPRSAYYMTRNGLLFLRQTRPGLRGLLPLGRALGRELMFIAVMTIRPRHRHRRVERNARLYGLLDFVRGRFGKMPEGHVSTTQS